MEAGCPAQEDFAGAALNNPGLAYLRRGQRSTRQLRITRLVWTM